MLQRHTLQRGRSEEPIWGDNIFYSYFFILLFPLLWFLLLPERTGVFIAGVKKHKFALHPGSRCNTSVLFLSRPLSRTTDAITA